MWMLCPCYVLVPVQFTPCPEIFGTRFPENREELDTRVSRWRLHCCCLRSDCLVVLWYAKQGLHQTCDVLNAPSGFRFSPGLGFPCPLFFWEPSADPASTWTSSWWRWWWRRQAIGSMALWNHGECGASWWFWCWWIEIIWTNGFSETLKGSGCRNASSDSKGGLVFKTELIIRLYFHHRWFLVWDFTAFVGDHTPRFSCFVKGI